VCGEGDASGVADPVHGQGSTIDVALCTVIAVRAVRPRGWQWWSGFVRGGSLGGLYGTRASIGMLGRHAHSADTTQIRGTSAVPGS
jgi:hypothetical protein